jgi:hypothetical protein
MKPVRDLCELQSNALDFRVSDGIEDLNKLTEDEAQGFSFFEASFITAGMHKLVSDGLARLAGLSGSTVYHLKQAMGGGKTHLLSGFGLVARHPKVRERYFADIASGREFGAAKLAFFNGRNNPAGFFWGDISEQLGKPNFFEPGTKAPDEQSWLKLFAGDEPILILLDEMPPYFHYYLTQSLGSGTIADVVTRAFANMLSAARQKAKVCIVISDLEGQYQSASHLINRALDDARAEAGRQEVAITPVDLSGNEIYEILKKRLFKKLPDQSTIDDIAAKYGELLTDAARSNTVARSAESIAEEISATYPFHPRLKNLFALFKENSNYKQTRGLMELTSRLLKSVWEGRSSGAFLIGPQHFDLGLDDVRDKLIEISAMSDVIAKDLWDTNSAAHAQVIDLNANGSEAKDVGAILFTSSLSTAVNSVRGLTRAEVLEHLVAPLVDISRCNKAFNDLCNSSWYIHRTPDEKYYFDKQENLGKMLQDMARRAPENKVEELKRSRIRELFKPQSKIAYEDVLPLPQLDEVIHEVRSRRVLLVVEPDGKLPPEEVKRFFESLSQRNNVCILTGEQAAVAKGKLTEAARNLYAVMQAEAQHKVDCKSSQWAEFDSKKATYDSNLTQVIIGVYDKLLVPVLKPGETEPVLETRSLIKEGFKPTEGASRVEKTLTENPKKLYVEVSSNMDTLRSMVEQRIWGNSDPARWADVISSAAENCKMPWLPSSGLEDIKKHAIATGLWEDKGGGYISKSPAPKTTGVQVSAESRPDDEGHVVLKISTVNGGPAPKIYYAEDASVSESSPVLDDDRLKTKALRVRFIVHDPSNHYITGEPYTWTNELTIRANQYIENGKRKVKILVAPVGAKVKFTLDGSEPRNGQTYSEPIEIGDNEVRLLVFAEADGLEARQNFTYPRLGDNQIKIDPQAPAKFKASRCARLSSRTDAYQGLQQAAEVGASFEDVDIRLTAKNGATINYLAVRQTLSAQRVTQLIESLGQDLPIEHEVTLSFRAANFSSGYDLKTFCDKWNIKLSQEEVEQCA